MHEALSIHTDVKIFWWLHLRHSPRWRITMLMKMYQCSGRRPAAGAGNIVASNRRQMPVALSSSHYRKCFAIVHQSKLKTWSICAIYRDEVALSSSELSGDDRQSKRLGTARLIFGHSIRDFIKIGGLQSYEYIAHRLLLLKSWNDLRLINSEGISEMALGMLSITSREWRTRRGAVKV